METFADRPDPKDDHTIGATLAEDGTPIYFHVPVDATDLDVSAMAFQARHDRPANQAEWDMLALIERHKGAVQL